MSILLQVILPVFFVVGFGYIAVWRKWFSDAGVEALMGFTQNFAIPCLLFRAISTLDLGQTFPAGVAGQFLYRRDSRFWLRPVWRACLV